MISQYIIQGIFAAAGIVSLLAALCNWEWFFTAHNTQFIVKNVGRRQARWFYGVLGVILISTAVFFCLNTHYRKKLNFTFEGLSAAKTSRARLMNQLGEHKASNAATTPEKLEAFRASFRNAIEDDMNVPLALGVLFTAIKEPKSKDIYELAKEFDCIFGLDLQKAEAVKAEEGFPCMLRSTGWKPLKLSGERSYRSMIAHCWKALRKRFQSKQSLKQSLT